MTPRWLHWPATAVGADATFTGTLGTWGAGTGRWTTSGTWSGSSSDFELFDNPYLYDSLFVTDNNYQSVRFLGGTGDGASILASHPSVYAIVTITPIDVSAAGIIPYTTSISSSTSGDLRLGNGSARTAAEYEDGGTLGLNSGDSVTIEIFFS